MTSIDLDRFCAVGQGALHTVLDEDIASRRGTKQGVCLLAANVAREALEQLGERAELQCHCVVAFNQEYVVHADAIAEMKRSGRTPDDVWCPSGKRA